MSTGLENLSNRTIGTLEILDIVQSSPRRYGVRCTRPGCNSQWTEAHDFIMTRLNAGQGLTCRNRNCVIGLIQPPTVERPEPPTQIAQPSIPAKAQKAAPQPQASSEYGNYYRHCLKYQWVQTLTPSEYNALSQRGRDFLADGRARDIERQRQQDAPPTRGDR